MNILDVGIFRLAEGRAIPAVGPSPAVVDVTPTPFATLTSDIGTVTLTFDTSVSPARFSPRTTYVVDGQGALHVPTSATLAADGFSATYSLAAPLPKCGQYSVNIANSLSSASGALLTQPSPRPELSGFFPPAAPVLNPHVTMTQAASVTVAGAITASSTVEISSPSGVLNVPATGGTFSADVPLRANEVNHVFFTAISDCGGVRSAPIATAITNDAQPPNLFIDFPPAGAELTVATTDVAGRVSDLLSGFMGLTVVVNGIAAEVDVGIGTNGTFLAQNVPLNLSTPTIISAVATDELGNTRTREISVLQVQIPPDAPRMTVVSGNRQEAVVRSLLPSPVVVKVTNADGTPFPNKTVTFQVTRSDGRLTANGAGDGSMMFQARTDINGEAHAFWKLGSDAGCGNNRVEVTSTSIAGTVGFCATARSAPAAQINLGSGNNQRAEAGGPATEPLRVWVSDSCNGVSNIPVTFTVIEGDGTVNGLSSVTINTADTGHAEVAFTLGPNAGSNVVEANFPSNITAPATFVVVGLVRDDTQPTSFSGLILNNAGQPVGGVPCSLTIGSASTIQKVSSAAGQFHFDNLSSAGPGHLFINGLQAVTVDGQPIQAGSLPALSFPLLLIPNVDNSLPMPVLLPTLNPANARLYTGAEDVELTVQGIDGLKMTIKAGSMTRRDGTVPSVADPAIVALNQVHADDIPMPMPDGASPPFAWTLQPGGATFDPPVEIVYPNMSGMPPGSLSNFLSFNHDTERFEIVATGQVNEDGSLIISDPGSGITKAGWGGVCPPYPVVGATEDCEPKSNGCGSAGGIQFFNRRLTCFYVGGKPSCESTVKACFGNEDSDGPCDKHDICYGTCGADRLTCDKAFRDNALSLCDSLFSQNTECNKFRFDCRATAHIYYWAIRLRGKGAYDAAQEEFCACNGLPVPFFSVQSTTDSGGLDSDDMDNDLLPDDWEIFFGLDPTDGDDTQRDPDQDLLPNVLEFLARTDPMNPDSDGDGIGDSEELENLQPTLPERLDSSWNITVAGQAVTPGAFGTFKIPNISMPDNFGEGGPGTPRDFVSDDFVRVTGTNTSGDVTLYVFSEPFRIRAGQTTVVTDLVIGDTPPPLPESVIFEPHPISPTAPDGTMQLAVTATLGNGTVMDVTPRTAWTTYRSSNPRVATVGPDGLVASVARGQVFITATNDGATAVTRIFISPDDPLTSVEGIVQTEDQSPVADAVVQIPRFGASTVTDVNGFFSFPAVPTEFGDLSINIQANIGGQSFGTNLFGVSPVPGGITDVGILLLSSFGLDSDSDCIPDDIEMALGLDPNDSDSNNNGILDGDEDFDADGLTNCLEVLFGSDLNNPDSDDDRLLDGAEFAAGADPINEDTDGDGFLDGEEVEFSSLPLDASSIPIRSSALGEQIGITVAVMNRADPSFSAGAAIVPQIVVHNLVDPSFRAGAVIAPTAITIHNQVDPALSKGEYIFWPIAVQNFALPDPNLSEFELVGPPVSLQNDAPP